MDAIRRANGLEHEPAPDQMLLIPIAYFLKESPTEGESVGLSGSSRVWGAGCLRTDYSNSADENHKMLSKTQKIFHSTKTEK